MGKWRVLAFARLHPWGGVGFVVPFYSVQDCCQHYFEVGLWGEKYVPVIKWALARSKNRMIKIGCFDFRLYWRVFISNNELINHDNLCVGAEGKCMLGVDAHVWQKILTCETLQTSQHGKEPQIAFTFDSKWHVRLFSPWAGIWRISLISFRNISTAYGEKTPK